MSNESRGWRGRRRPAPAPAPGEGPDGGARADGAPRRPDLTRRVFLRNGSLTVAAAGLLSAAPGLPGLFSEVAPDAPAADTGAADVSELVSGALAEPLVVQVRDLQTGEMSVYLGEREIAYRDPGLASKLLRAAR